MKGDEKDRHIKLKLDGGVVTLRRGNIMPLGAETKTCYFPPAR